ncbi:N-methyl-D-aspartate receptor NMDAR2C subunit [Pseudacidovorax sp. RU35E]|uniref:HD domain-containing protein n=1 Tax=Pseudacidovorax sp. RU35E TaxID=1907403 RepID=UPI00095579AA|nr:N-methyl-D-aspartate receptor NMDAR2C subunit [Pseudacidovorax sp. RU35E]SIQ98001.1 Predicted metal-dependent phosphohydrolase, HD superfamily [Pseudacidovorax sp. RU35E]
MDCHTFLDRHRAVWLQAWAGAGVQAPAGLLEQLCTRYAEPHRHYHSLQHLDECLALLAAHHDVAERPAEVALALWFHDAVYDVHAGDNEARSADWARDALRGGAASAGVADRVHALVMSTRHGLPDLPLPETPDTRLLLDVDLAILGADPQRYAEYERQIRAEYAHVPPEVFEPRRRKLMGGFLARQPLYLTAPLRAAREAQARRNLAGAVAG